MRTVVARDATGYCLTNADLQIYYWMEFYQLMNNYGSYASMLGLDYTKAAWPCRTPRAAERGSSIS